MNDRLRYFGCPNVFTLVVGEDREELYVARSILEQIPFFATALKDGQFKEAKDKKFDMPQDDPEAVANLLHFTLTSRVPPIFDPNSPTSSCTELRKYVNAFVVADKFMAEGIANGIIDQISIYHSSRLVEPEFVGTLRNVGLQDSKLYEFLVGELAVQLRGCMKEANRIYSLVYEVAFETIKDILKNDEMSSDDLLAVLLALLKTEPNNPRLGSTGRQLPGCSLHTHQLTQMCS